MADEKVTIIVNAKDNASKVLGGIGNMFSGIAKVAGGILTAGIIQDLGRAVVDFGKDSISAASDLNETANKIQVVFGDSSDAVNEFAKNASTALGQSTQSALDAAATFGVFGKAAGLSGADLAGFSTDLTSLASDMASFYNTSPEDAITAIGAALRGESEPIRRYGVLLDDASMRQKALELGIISTTKNALTPAQKVLAAQALIMEQTADAQGDFARTSDGLANSQRIVAAQMANLKTELGAAFLPIVQKVVGLISTQLMPALSKFVQNVIVPAAPAVAALVDGFLNLLSGGLQLPGMLNPLMGALQNLFGAVRDSGPMVMDALGAMWDFVVTTWATVGPYIIGNLTSIVNTIADLWRKHGADIMAVLSFTWNTIVVTIMGAINIITGLVSAFLSLLNGDTTKALSTLQSTWFSFMNSVLSLVGTNLTEFNAMWTNNFNMLKTIVTVGLDMAKNAITTAVTGFISAGRALVDGIMAGIKAKWNEVISWLQAQAAKLPDVVKAVLGIHSPSAVFADIGKNMMLGMGQGISGASGIPVAAAVRAATSTVSNTYNLTINEAGRRGNVVSDFNLMRSLAGA